MGFYSGKRGLVLVAAISFDDTFDKNLLAFFISQELRQQMSGEL